MLGTPPAFVLSQDQTLKKLYLKAKALKSSFWLDLSSKYTQEFSLAVLISSYTRFLNNPLIVQGVIVCLYVIQFTRYRHFHSLFAVAFAFAANFVSLAHVFEFVKHFFQVFSNSFVLFVGLQACALHRATCIYYHSHSLLSSTFLQIFHIFLGHYNNHKIQSGGLF